MVSDTFAEVFAELNGNVTEITNSQGNTPSLNRSNGNQWYGAYPDTELITSKSKYPIGILDTPTFSEEQVGLHTNEVTLNMTVAVHGTRKENPPRFAEKAADHIRNNSDKFDRLYDFTVSGSDEDTVVAGKGDMKIHMYSVTLQFKMIVDP